MKMRKIKNEWRTFLVKESTLKANEAAKPEAKPKEVASVLIIDALNGNSTDEVKSYMENNIARVISVLEQEFNKYFNIEETRGLEYFQKTTKPLIVMSHKVSGIRNNSVRFQDTNELEFKVNTLINMLKNDDFDFDIFNPEKSPYKHRDYKHSGGASSAGVEVPDSATDKQKEFIGTRISKYVNAFLYPDKRTSEHDKYKAREGMAQALSMLVKITDSESPMLEKLEDALEEINYVLKNTDLPELPPEEESELERADILLARAATGDKEAAKDAFMLFRKLKNNIKAREARKLMR